ncbi:PTS sorbitol transporter subunit IIA [Anopheles sinensis]|uniref:PTS sorbitol transporter subunit IIA n=1 Tax=Anopheles sinensis TaxID=74873 RepID=A0A084W4R6_ANOSI|nr:PTS sorbitol transporter subunit IIA [Anopheles sinensis]
MLALTIGDPIVDCVIAPSSDRLKIHRNGKMKLDHRNSTVVYSKIDNKTNSSTHPASATRLIRHKKKETQEEPAPSDRYTFFCSQFVIVVCGEAVLHCAFSLAGIQPER